MGKIERSWLINLSKRFTPLCASHFLQLESRNFGVESETLSWLMFPLLSFLPITFLLKTITRNRVSMRWWLLRLTVKIPSKLRLTVTIFPLWSPEKLLTVNFFLRLTANFWYFLRLTAKSLGHFRAHDEPHWDHLEISFWSMIPNDIPFTHRHFQHDGPWIETFFF